MKKIIPIIMLVALALTGCQTQNPYAGTYTGTFTFLNYNTTGNLTGNDAKKGKMQFLTNPLTNGLFLYSVIPLTQVSSTYYVSNSSVLDFATILLQNIGYTNSVYNSVSEKIKNVAITAEFSGNSVHAEVQYEITILGTLNTRLTVVTFDGVK